jgi:proteasome lid subunit RPN8/RPN11
VIGAFRRNILGEILEGEDLRMLVLNSDEKTFICEDAVKAYPNECCGILLGKRREDGSRYVSQIFRAVNVADKSIKQKHFEICAEALLYAEFLAVKNDCEIVGFYHSHTDCEAVASGEDSRYAIPGFSYPIVSIVAGKVEGMSSWELEDAEYGGNLKEELISGEMEVK